MMTIMLPSAVFLIRLMMRCLLQEGKPVARFSKKFLTSDIAPYIKKLIEEGPDAEL